MLVLEPVHKGDRQLHILTVTVFCGLGILLAGLWYVQVLSRKRFQEEQVAQSLRTVRLPAVRGRILDRSGEALAENRPSYNVSLYVEELSKQFKAAYQGLLSAETNRVWQTFRRKLTREERAQVGRWARYYVVSNIVYRLGLLLEHPVQLEPAEFHRHYEERLALPLPVLQNLNSNQVARLQELTGMPPGLDLDIQPMRVYQFGATAAHVLGYLRKDETSREGEEAFYNYRLPDYEGVIGVEGYFDAQLRGRAGAKSVLVNSLGYRQSESIWAPPEAGRCVVLTIDVHLQQAVEKALAGVENQTGLPARGAAVVLDASNGDILALASIPAYNPGDFIPSISRSQMAQLNDEYMRPLINRATQERYPPGSIFKIVTALAALEAGILNPEELLPNPGHIQVGNRTIKDTAPPGDYDFKRALKLSSNTYFIHYGLKAGLSRILQMGRKFHLGEPWQLPTFQNDGGIFPTTESIRRQASRGDPWTDGDTANLCIGQGAIAVNPLQMAVMTAAVANGGRVYWPRLVQRIEPMEPDSNEQITHFPHRLYDELGVAEHHLRLLRDAMLADVEDSDGTGRRAAVPGLRICGKTGTAEIKKGQQVVDKVTWFVSFAPYEQPRYVVVVMVESGVSGGHTCAPVAGQIYRALLSRLYLKT